MDNIVRTLFPPILPNQLPAFAYESGDNNQPIFTVIDDDFKTVGINKILPIWNKRGIKGSFSINTGFMDGNYSDYGSLNYAMGTLYNQGHDFLAHGYTHENLQELISTGDENFYWQIQGDTFMMYFYATARGETKFRGQNIFVYPYTLDESFYGSANVTILKDRISKQSAIMDNGALVDYSYAISDKTGFNPLPLTDTFEIKRTMIDTSKTFMQLKQIVDNTVEEKGWLILGSKSADATFNEEVYQQILDYIIALGYGFNRASSAIKEIEERSIFSKEDNDYDGTFKFKFSISDINSRDEIVELLVSIVNANTGKSTITPQQSYRSDYLFFESEDIFTSEEDNGYYVHIPIKHLAGPNIPHIARAKISSTRNYITAAEPSNSNHAVPNSALVVSAINANLRENANKISETSKGCYLMGITSPTFGLDNYDMGEGYLTTSFTGYYSPPSDNQNESLLYYNFSLYNLKGALIEKGENIYSQIIGYNFRTDILPNTEYIVKLTITTKNLYTDSISMSITTASQGGLAPRILVATANGEKGVIELTAPVDTDYDFINFKRADYESGFLEWSDLYKIPIVSTKDISVVDKGAESGKIYQYGVFYSKSSSQISANTPMQKSSKISVFYEDCYLVGDNRQLRIELDNKVNSYKINVGESTQVTLGGKFPFFQGNANTRYRTFGLSGTISKYMDEDFYTIPSEISSYLDSLALGSREEQNMARDYREFIEEKEYRKQVESFLYRKEFMLYKSPTEGLIIGKLMNISLTPNETLGRRVWGFSGEFVEAADFSLEELDKYNIQNKEV